jgi:hypothetical protein
VSLPGKAKPWDVLVRNGKLYVLGVIANQTGNYTVTVSETADLAQWKELFRFQSDTFARSFEELNGDFYFGLGSEISPLPSSTGDILRVRKASWFE